MGCCAHRADGSTRTLCCLYRLADCGPRHELEAESERAECSARVANPRADGSLSRCSGVHVYPRDAGTKAASILANHTLELAAADWALSRGRRHSAGFICSD